MKLLTLGIAMMMTMASSYATTVIVTNGRGPANTREIIPPTLPLALATGFGGVGFLSEAAINGAQTTFAGLNFTQYGNAGGAVSTSTSGQFSFTDNLNIDTVGSAFSGKNIYLVVGFGGTNLATSTSLFIYKFAATFGTADSALPITQTLTDPTTPGSVLLGGNSGADPQTTASARYTAVALAAVPEI